MQFLLSREELYQGCQLVFETTTEILALEDVYDRQEKLNNAGYFTVIRDVENENVIGDIEDDSDELKYVIDCYTRLHPIVEG